MSRGWVYSFDLVFVEAGVRHRGVKVKLLVGRAGAREGTLSTQTY